MGSAHTRSTTSHHTTTTHTETSITTTTTLLHTMQNPVLTLQQIWNQLHLPCVHSSEPSILKDMYGRPQIPTGFIGSISHKACTGVALVTTSTKNKDPSNVLPPPSTALVSSIGVDIERTFSRRSSIAKKVLTANEMKQLGKLQNVTKEEEVLLRFR
jgi:4'-phosphopantetheinyl transferase EntD